MKIFETERLILRNWGESDAESLYEIARDENVGPACGWTPHKNIEESQFILKNILMNDHTFAIILKQENKIIGNIGFITMPGSRYCENEFQHEIGFWLGYSYWGNGYMPEACKYLMMYGFEQLKLEKIICTHVIENDNSKRVQKKCNFKYANTDRFFHEIRNREVIMIVNQISREDYYSLDDFAKGSKGNYRYMPHLL